MTHEITLKVGSPHVLRDHIAEAVVGYSQGSDIRNTLEDLLDQVGEQLPKPAIVEPAEFGSLIRAEAPHHYKALWTPSPTSGDHYWMSEKGYVEVWSQLADVEVLRVGLGGEYSPSLQQIRDLLFRSPTGYLNNEETLAAYKDLRRGLSDLLSGRATENPLTASDLSRMSVEAHQAKLNGEAEAFREGEAFGQKVMNGRIHVRLRELLADAITSERKNALEKAIQAVEELAP